MEKPAAAFAKAMGAGVGHFFGQRVVLTALDELCGRTVTPYWGGRPVADAKGQPTYLPRIGTVPPGPE
ncbi:MAG TPA: hypothetical protein VIV60_12610 [Polyangiaceae bacterium]